MRFSRKTRGRRQRGRETERQRDRDRPGFKGPSVSFGAVGPKSNEQMSRYCVTYVHTYVHTYISTYIRTDSGQLIGLPAARPNKPQAKRSDGGQPVRFKSSISYIKNHGNMH